MARQPIGEYRGCTLIMDTAPGRDPIYGNSCTTGWRYTIARVKEDIDAYRDTVPEPTPPPEEPEPEPPTDEDLFVETYRGVDIFYNPRLAIYKFTVQVGYSGVHGSIEEARASIDSILAFLGDPGIPPAPPGQVDPEDPIAGTYGDVTIYINAFTGLFYFTYLETLFSGYETLEDAIAYIDNVLGVAPPGPPIEPGDEPDYTSMDKDPARAAAIAGPVNAFLSSVGLTPEALESVRGSGADPEKAAQFAQSVSLASVGAVAILGSIGVVAEVASLGQVEGVTATIDMVLEKTGISGLLTEMFKLPFMSALVAPARHYWNSVYTPEISGLSQLTMELVREVITLDTYIAEAAMQGLSRERAMRIWDAHWLELGLRQIDDIFHRGGMTEEEWAKYRVIQDYRPDARPGFEKSDLEMSRLLRKTLLGRVDTRRAYQYGYMKRPDLINMYLFQGYEEDAELQADIQIRASVDGLQSAIRRETGMMFRDRLKDAREDEKAAVGAILRERDTEIIVITLRWRAEEMEEVDLMLIPTVLKDRALDLGPIEEEEALVLEADMRAKADTAIAGVREAARLREVEAEEMYRAALVEVGDLIDPIDLWVIRYKLAAARVEVAEEFEIEAPVLVSETFEEPE